MMRTVLTQLCMFTLFSAVSAGLAQAPVLGVRSDPKLGALWTDAGGKTLYVFTKDTPGVSNCEGQCAQNWPPLTASEVPQLPAGTSGTLSLIERKDGTRQVAYNGHPLYTWIKDTKAGDTSGQGVGGVWFAANLEPTVQVAQLGALGNALVGPQGKTLYLFTKDTANQSNCEGQCAQNWPPLLVSQSPTAADEITGKLGTIKRKDGTLQVTYNGMPLYFWVKDTKAGDATGQNVGGVWFVVKP